MKLQKFENKINQLTLCLELLFRAASVVRKELTFFVLKVGNRLFGNRKYRQVSIQEPSQYRRVSPTSVQVFSLAFLHKILSLFEIQEVTSSSTFIADYLFFQRPF